MEFGMNGKPKGQVYHGSGFSYGRRASFSRRRSNTLGNVGVSRCPHAGPRVWDRPFLFAQSLREASWRTCWCYLTAPQWNFANDFERGLRVWGSLGHVRMVVDEWWSRWKSQQRDVFCLGRPLWSGRCTRNKVFGLAGCKHFVIQSNRTVRCRHKDGMAFCEGTSEDRSPLPT